MGEAVEIILSQRKTPVFAHRGLVYSKEVRWTNHRPPTGPL